MLDIAERIVVFAAGIAIVLGTFRSAVRTLAITKAASPRYCGGTPLPTAGERKTCSLLPSAQWGCGGGNAAPAEILSVVRHVLA